DNTLRSYGLTSRASEAEYRKEARSRSSATCGKDARLLRPRPSVIHFVGEERTRMENVPFAQRCVSILLQGENRHHERFTVPVPFSFDRRRQCRTDSQANNEINCSGSKTPPVNDDGSIVAGDPPERADKPYYSRKKCPFR
ncbi:hypothetical protein KIN20_032554, partial [Parelaphostrongylus tenuis]